MRGAGKREGKDDQKKALAVISSWHGQQRLILGTADQALSAPASRAAQVGKQQQ